MGLILPYLDRVFVGLHFLLRVRLIYYASGWFITRADDFLRVRMVFARAACRTLPTAYGSLALIWLNAM